MELTQLRYFMVIAERGHLTRAAQALGVTQPALSAMLKKLEGEAGAPLLHRTSRGVELTEAGRVFLEHARHSVRAADAGVEAVRELLGLDRGSIRIGGGATATTYLLPGIVSSFHEEHPGIRFHVREQGSREIAAALLADELDIGVVTLPVRIAGDQDLVVSEWLEDELRLIVPEGHPLEERKQFRWSELEDEPVVAFESGSAVRSIVDQGFERAGVPVRVVMELRSIESIKQMVSEGVGVGFVTRFALPADAGLRCKDGKITRRLAIVRRGDLVPSPAVGAFERAMRAFAGDGGA